MSDLDPARRSRWLTTTRLKRLTIGLLIAFVPVLVGYRLYELFAVPDIGEPFDVAAFTSYTLPDPENAYTHYRNALALYVREETVIASDPTFKSKEFWTNKTEAEKNGWEHAIPAVRRWVEVNRPMLDEWKRGAKLAASLRVPLSEVSKAPPWSYELSPVRNCAILMSLEGSRLTAELRFAEAWGYYRDLLRSGRHLAMHGTLLDSMVGDGFVELGDQGGLRWSAEKRVTAADLRKAIQDVLSVQELRTPASDTIKVEYLFLADFADNGISYGKAIPPWLRLTGYPAQAGRTARLVVANLLSQAGRPRYRRRPVHPGALGLFELDPAIGPDPKVRAPEEIERSSVTSAASFAKLVKLISPDSASEIEDYDPQRLSHNFAAAYQVQDTAQARLDALLLALALQLHYREHAEFPASLDELVKRRYLKSIPADPFGKREPFHYRREANPADGAVLWSVWRDGIDQDGREGLHWGDGDWIVRVRVPGTGGAPRSTH
jgi:hypothetical protein